MTSASLYQMWQVLRHLSAENCERTSPASTQNNSDEKLDALNTLVEKLISSSVLAVWQLHGTYTADTDAYDREVGCVLLQKQPGGLGKKTSYCSRSLTGTERVYDLIPRECLAVVYGVLLLRPYLEGTHLTALRDQDGLKWILILACATDKLA